MKVLECSRQMGKTLYVQEVLRNPVARPELEECPFCKGRAVHEKREPLSKFFALNNHYIKCCSCNARTAGCDTPEEAAEKWNRR